MSPPNERGPASQPSPQETATAAPSKITRTDGTGYVSIRDQVAAGIITTTRTCEGAYCWCRVGDYVVGYDHRQFMDTLARGIRAIEVREGVLGI